MTLVAVGQGGSDRDYFRVTIPGRDPFILMRYGRLREENKLYAAIAGFLRGIGVAVPEILGHDPETGAPADGGPWGRRPFCLTAMPPGTSAVASMRRP